MRIAVLISGGKDSALALHHALQDGYEVRFLVAMIPRREDSWMFHYPNIHLTDLFAKAAEIPLVKGETEGVKEKELDDLKRVLAGLDVEGVVSGAVASQYQKQRIQKACEELGLSSITPLWRRDPMEILKELVDLKFEAVITGVYAQGFTEEWLGRRINAKTINALQHLHHKHGISLVGEGGEYETLVLDAPFFKRRIVIVETERIWDDQSGWLKVRKAILANK
jgi:diphthine-ammonia ligase